jgi:hypothetical protein
LEEDTMFGRIGRVAARCGGIGAVGLALGVAGPNADTAAPAASTLFPASLRAEAQQILDVHASLLSNATRIALGMAASGRRELIPAYPAREDPVSRSRALLRAQAVDTGPLSDGAIANASANVRVNDPAEDSHEYEQTTQSETSIAVSGAHVAVGFNDSQNGLVAAVAGDDLAGYAYSTDAGATFTDGGALPNAPGFINLGDPWLTTDATGVMYYANLGLSINTGSLEVVVSRSTDGGRTWSLPAVASTGTPGIYFADKDALVAGAGPQRTGSALYAAWDDFSLPGSGAGGGGGGGGAPRFGLAVSHSYDGGRTWQLRYADRIKPGTGCSFGQYIGADPVVDNATGILYLAAERIDVSDPTCGDQAPQTTFSERCFVSLDGGNTFTRGTTIAIVNPVASPIVLGATSAMRDAEFPSMVVRGGVLAVAWNDTSPSGGAQVRLAQSSDGGRRWSSVFVTSGPGQRIQPALSSDASGLHLLYYRVNPNLTLDVIAADSPDAHTWTFTRVNTQSFRGVENNPQFDPLIVPTYMGDYISNVSDGTHRYFAWGDDRDVVVDFLWPRGRLDPDVFFAGG